MKSIILTQNKVALVDDDTFEDLNAFRWYAYTKKTKRNDGCWYAARKIRINGKWTCIHMHSQIMNSRECIDHIDNDGLNNQRDNLRFASSTQNHANNRKRINCSSIYKGVCFLKSRNKWLAQIMMFQKRKFLGHFDSEEDAAKAYDLAAKKLFGDFAKLNFKD